MNLKFLNNVIFPEWIEKYDDEVISNIKYVAQNDGRYLEKFSDRNFVVKRSLELAKSTKCKKLNATQKLIFISNVIFDNDDDFIYKMGINGWTKEKSEELNNLITKIRILQKKNLDVDLDISLLEELITISIKYFGIENPVILINRLNELTVTKKDELNHIKKY